ncbi:MAG: putative 4-hydroxybenzoate polyprenyltransferase [Proteobacteria bacterium]|nr:putative 4-hydroxybenzoate polyprenyltransferase [Pseudomonadota bacterium]MBU1741794.1 putative 4-hydroxybenzoate polyprenyltransferase [Pseudomonadota bacterium]
MISVFWRLIKFEHTVFALPLAYAGACLAADGWPGWRPAWWILAAMVGARSAAMAFNRLVDRRLDAQNPRTRDRALPRGELGRAPVTIFLLVSVAFFVLAAARLNPTCLILSPLALAVILGYSWTKRFTWLSHLFLGLALAGAPLGGFLAVQETISGAILVFAGGVVFWVAGFDVIYACQDIEFDRRAGLHSIPARLGGRTALVLSALFHALAWAFFVTAGVMSGLGWPYYLGLAVVGGLLIVEHFLVSPDDLNRLEAAFFTVNSYVSVALLAAVVADGWWA